ncbi:MAG: response regulator transcription factor, partial [Acidobacteriaceae bacterium]|nr:response regulator transcription factor [Acidobacteriaceae bacterium]
MPPIHVLIADDHALIRSGLRALLEREQEFQVVGEAANGYEAVQLTQSLKPDIAMFDVGMPRLSGIDAAQQVAEKMPAVRIIILSMHSDEGYVLRALRAGAKGYVLKASAENDVLAAVRAVASGNAYFSPEISRMLAEEYVREAKRRGVEDSYDLLSAREKEIMHLLVTGKSNRQIADMVHISAATVETHRTN